MGFGMLGFATTIYTDTSSNTEIPPINRGFWSFTAQPNLRHIHIFIIELTLIVLHIGLTQHLLLARFETSPAACEL